ncbi:MAG: hypothetical protein JW841_05085 [Deltaproteobacteria bacterium]|nr:hypothetical protein [Deltaproteobacteria bacterium]
MIIPYCLLIIYYTSTAFNSADVDSSVSENSTNLNNLSPEALRFSKKLYETAKWVTSVESAYMMDGGWRGNIRIVPQLPVGKYLVHLKHLNATTEDFAAFFAALTTSSKSKINYRWQNLQIKFFKSVGRSTPSAYASNWSIAYNVNGSLLRNSEGVRLTLFHEIYHLNDENHQDWSRRMLTPFYTKIIKQCTIRGRLSNDCLKPFAPGKTKVRGSVYYAFHPGEGVEEYGAELALRYYIEHREILLKRHNVKTPFKCINKTNEEAWGLLSKEFFASVDKTDPCRH